MKSTLIKRFFGAVGVFALMVCVVKPVHATVYTSSTTTVSTGFDAAWEKYKSLTITVSGIDFGAYMYYGYDT